MEFMCALSVNGSLAHYFMRSDSNKKFTATLRTATGKQPDVPEEVILTKEGGEWRGHPPHTQIVQSLIQAIEASNRSEDTV